jgi:hypothetical protein
VAAASVTVDTEGNHGRMLEEKQEIGDAVGFAIVDERLLEPQGVGILDHAQAPHFE